MGRLPSGEPSVERSVSSCGAVEQHRGARRRWSCVVKALRGVAVATRFRVATGSAVAMPCPVAIRLSRCPPPSRWCCDGLRGRNSVCVASGVSVAQLCVGVCPRVGFALRTFW
ncbi:hypothetical protein Taro_026072 [Colocasia esculenta]|uniref:Uncharacterized protein n=1 Tax=Colocasia esculenta TaxID=4460 RepID=A0A843VQ73_COLES|nr:hypothetical protein [Colocasia esculenta]